MKDHQAVQELLSLAAAGVLNPKEQQRVQEHLQRCDICRVEFDDWQKITHELRILPTPQAPVGLLLRTQRLIQSRQFLAANNPGSLLLPSLLLMFSWVSLFLNYHLLRLIDMPLAKWLDISTTAIWISYIGISWLAAALSVGFFARHLHREGKTV
jgi:anti-sigma factor RsiW